MHSSWLVLTLALNLSPFVCAIPVAPQQALSNSQRGQDYAAKLIDYVLNSDLRSAQITYATVQRQLDNLGMYLGQLTGSACPAPTYSGPTESSQQSVIEALQSMQLDLSSLSQGITNKNQGDAVSAWEAAQQSLDSTFAYVFNTTTSTAATSASGTAAPSASSTSSSSVYTYIQAAQVALNNLAADIVHNNLTSARQDYGAAYMQLNSDIGPAVPCSPFSSNATTCIAAGTLTSEVSYVDVLVCIQNVQMALTEWRRMH